MLRVEEVMLGSQTERGPQACCFGAFLQKNCPGTMGQSPVIVLPDRSPARAHLGFWGDGTRSWGPALRPWLPSLPFLGCGHGPRRCCAPRIRGGFWKPLVARPRIGAAVAWHRPSDPPQPLLQPPGRQAGQGFDSGLGLEGRAPRNPLFPHQVDKACHRIIRRIPPQAPPLLRSSPGRNGAQAPLC
jgi:hypothetical protein